MSQIYFTNVEVGNIYNSIGADDFRVVDTQCFQYSDGKCN